jgi:hypothetical protein
MNKRTPYVVIAMLVVVGLVGLIVMMHLKA